MTLKRQLEVYRNARRSDGLDVGVLDAAIVRVARADRVLHLLVVGAAVVGTALVASAAFAR